MITKSNAWLMFFNENLAFFFKKNSFTTDYWEIGSLVNLHLNNFVLFEVVR